MRCLEILEAANPIKMRFRDFAPDEWQTLYSRFERAEDFADRVIDPQSPAAPATRLKLIKAWTDWNHTEKPPQDPLRNLSGLRVHIAKAIGATAWRPVQQVPWGTEMMYGPDCYMFNTPRGGVFLDAAVIDKAIWMSQISTERRGNGLGTIVMNALQDYARQHGLGVKIFKVTNTPFFDRFPWLRRDNDTYTAMPDAHADR